VNVVADRLGMPLVHDERHGVWALGPESGDRVLASSELPPIVLTDVDGQPFDLTSLRGEKVLIAAWASW
jgi:cytochrome oxidase Cu insertion factor (SCO1/SenC/PrrC family)